MRHLLQKLHRLGCSVLKAWRYFGRGLQPKRRSLYRWFIHLVVRYSPRILIATLISNLLAVCGLVFSLALVLLVVGACTPAASPLATPYPTLRLPLSTLTP